MRLVVPTMRTVCGRMPTISETPLRPAKSPEAAARERDGNLVRPPRDDSLHREVIEACPLNVAFQHTRTIALEIHAVQAHRGMGFGIVFPNDSQNDVDPSPLGVLATLVPRGLNSREFKVFRSEHGT